VVARLGDHIDPFLAGLIIISLFVTHFLIQKSGTKYAISSHNPILPLNNISKNQKIKVVCEMIKRTLLNLRKFNFILIDDVCLLTILSLYV
jgi:hypothetical protein